MPYTGLRVGRGNQLCSGAGRVGAPVAQLAAMVSAAVATSAAAFAWLCWRGQPGLAAWQPCAIYLALPLALLVPLDFAYKARPEALARGALLR